MRTVVTSPAALYYVPSSGNQRGGIPRFYLVAEFPGSRQPLRCECKAGQNARRCWHVGAVEAGMVKAARPKGAAPATPTAPAAAPTPAPTPQPQPATVKVPWFLPPDDGYQRRQRNRVVLESLYA